MNFRALVLIVALFLLNSCSTQQAPTRALKNADRLRSVPIGADKADILRTFGAPTRIEIENKKFRYTYFESRKSKVTIHFDEKNKVASVTK